VPKNHRNKEAAIPERGKLHARYKRVSLPYNAAARRVLRRLQGLIEKAGINASIKYRVKSFESYFEKILRQRKRSASRELLTDILGFRVICPFLKDLGDVEQLIQTNFKVVEVEVKAGQHSFREFGYDSTHLLVDLSDELPGNALPGTKRMGEIQLRTILQDAWAEVEHEIIYKQEYSLLHDPIKRKLASLNATLTLSDIIFQEIRDYQKDLHQRDTRRKGSLEGKMMSGELISMLDDVGESPPRHKADDVPATTHHGNDVNQLVFTALAAHSTGDFVKAIQIYSSVLRMKTTQKVRSVIYHHRGMAYFVLSQYKRAIQNFSNAIRYDPECFRAYNNRALTYRILHQYERALHDLDCSLEINTTQAEGYYVRALTHFDLEDFSKALRDCNSVLNIKPDFIAVQHLKKLIASKITK
jgi:putative GTP pyrophosphokinase